jgi:hypothetical protein
MGLVQVDIVSIQPAQRSFDSLEDMSARQAFVIGALTHAPAHFGGDHQLLSGQLGLFQPVADHGFGDAARVARRPA